MRRFSRVGMVCATALFLSAQAAPPSAVQSPLQQLHRSAALGAHWEGFSSGSWVRARIHDVLSKESELWSIIGAESTRVRTEEVVYPFDDYILTNFWDGDHKGGALEARHALEEPTFVAAEATRLPDDSVPIGKKLYPAQVYQFEKSVHVLRETQTIRWTFWLSPEVPGGELRRLTQAESDDPTYGDQNDLKLVDLDVPFVVGKNNLDCYCQESTDTHVDGRVERGRICYSDKVPGGIVRKEIRVLKNGKEIQRQEYVLIDYHVER